MRINAIITAGGTSSRFGNTNKLLEKINGKEVIRYTVDAFLGANVDKIIICANVAIMEELEKIFYSGKLKVESGKLNNSQLSTFNFQPDIEIIKGGATRQESVYNGLKHSECNYVLIHDGARPMITTDLINQAIEMVKEKKALTVATKTIDTIKEVVDGKIIKTIDRSKLYNTQTPQAFEYDLIKEAHEKLKELNFTDDAGMLEALGVDVYILNGSYKNIKITTKNDIDIAKIYLEQN
ncbi:2-C-methyl-D-erythritol 4-phosphate cytidylyltransferase [bacterium]|nr:2-C-methyl-D-erythritol 4-phosphate cytidylyltransferase [bacterium]